MDKILTDFGVQPIYLAAQIVNFIILVIILKRFLYKPVLKVLQERKLAAENTLFNAEKIAQQLQNTEHASDQILAEAKAYAQTIIKKAATTADQIIAEAHEKVEADIESMMAKSKQTISIEREAIKNELRQELAGLVILGVEKVAGKVLEEADQKKILARTIKELQDNTA